MNYLMWHTYIYIHLRSYINRMGSLGRVVCSEDGYLVLVPIPLVESGGIGVG